MTNGEVLFYLREIRLQWSTSNVSPDKLAELQAAKLIEFNNEPIRAVRLTSEGARVKSAGQPKPRAQGISLTGKIRPMRQHRPKRLSPRVRPLV